MVGAGRACYSLKFSARALSVLVVVQRSGPHVVITYLYSLKIRIFVAVKVAGCLSPSLDSSAPFEVRPGV
ncbi:hypothetical protein INR49_001010 [Caranx melampygus]|nr:hypothetical protein INR49_001010 [Caranx melampygus]